MKEDKNSFTALIVRDDRHTALLPDNNSNDARKSNRKTKKTEKQKQTKKQKHAKWHIPPWTHYFLVDKSSKS